MRYDGMLRSLLVAVCVIALIICLLLSGAHSSYNRYNCKAVITVDRGTSKPKEYEAKTYNVTADGCVHIVTMDGELITVCGSYRIENR